MDENERNIDTTIELDTEFDSELDEGPEEGPDIWPFSNTELDAEPDMWAYSGQDTNLYSGIELDAELDMEPDPESAGTELSEAEPEDEEETLSEEELALLMAKRRKRQRKLVLVAAIAWICVAFTFLYVNGIGPFAVKDKGTEGSGTDATPSGTGDDAPADWVTAGKNYENLYKLIEEQTYYLRNSMPHGGIEELDDAMPVTETEEGDAWTPPEDFTEPEFEDGGYFYMPQLLVEEGLDYSENNEQYKNFSTADVVKTDGEYIYAINNKNLFIVSINKGEMELLSKIPQPAENSGQAYYEMYVENDLLIAIRCGFGQISYPIDGNVIDTSVDIFDISDRAAPVLLQTLSQSGDYNNSLISDGYLYLISTYYLDVMQISAADPGTFVPFCAEGGEQFMLNENDIYLPPGTTWPCFTVISGIDTRDTGSFVSQKSVYGNVGTIYESPGAVYLAHTTEKDEQKEVSNEFIAYSYWSETVLTKLTFSLGQIVPGAQTCVPGYVPNQFSLDEYNGVFRLVTTSERSTWYGNKDQNIIYTSEEWEQLPKAESKISNAFYMLDAKFGLIACIDDIAPDDRISSCRFMRGAAYFTTFQQADQLFSIDLGDAAASNTTGVLEISEFPEYMHRYQDGRLFGLGHETDSVTKRWQGLKLMMFDDSDPVGLRELHTLTLGNENSAIVQNHKSIIVNEDRALFAFPADGKYLFYSYNDSEGFNKITEVKFESGVEARAEIRGLFVGEIFYIVDPNNVGAYSAKDSFSRIGILRVDEGAKSVGHGSGGMFAGSSMPAQ